MCLTAMFPDTAKLILIVYSTAVACSGSSTLYVQTDSRNETAKSKVSFVRRQLATLSEDAEHPPVISPDGQQVAYAVRGSPGRHYVVIGIARGEDFDEVSDPVFSPDGTKSGYIGIREQDPWEYYLIITNKRLGPFVWLDGPYFSPDAKRLAYVAAENIAPDLRKAFLVVDDRKLGLEFDWVSTPPVFSADGTSVAYKAGQGAESVIVLNGRSGERFDWVGNPVFSHDGLTLAYAAKSGEQCCVVVGRQKGDYFDAVGNPHFGRNPDFVAYKAERADRMLMVVKGRQSSEYDYVSDPTVSPDGERIAYLAAMNTESGEKRYHLIIADEVRDVISTPYDDVGEVIFSHDGTRVAYVVGEGAYRIRKYRVVSGDKTFREYDGIIGLVFGPGGEQIAYLAQNRDRSFIMVGDRKLAVPGDGNAWGPPSFSPDGKTIAYMARTKGGVYMVAANAKSEVFDNIYLSIFSPDSRKIAFAARKGLELWWEVLDVSE